MANQITTADAAIFWFSSLILLFTVLGLAGALWLTVFRKKNIKKNLMRALESYLPGSSVRNEFEQIKCKYDQLYKETLAGLYRMDLDGSYMEINPTYRALLGYNARDKKLFDNMHSPRHLYGDAAEFDLLIEKVKKKKFVSAYEVLLETKSRGLQWFSQTLKLHADANPPYIEGKMLDISRLKQAQTELKSAKEKAEFAGRVKTEFLANISHELRTPLNAIIGFSEIIKNEMLGPIEKNEYTEYAEDIYNSGQLLLKLINDILDVAKIESGKRELNEKILNINRVVDEALRLLRMRAAQNNVQLKNMLASDLPDVQVDEVALKQIISNLVTNAIKFTHAGGEVSILGEVNKKGQFELSVKDTGVGIAKDDIQRVLTPFAQAGDVMQKNEGTGLGLPIVVALTELHGGTFELISELGHGSLATMTLPKNRVFT